ncbi:hypothetical protein LUZ63_012010 [Rhynchospora breviuscula]|uniref:Pentatricopeptide repeat-containing protein n=1 Tax=Rhynchospora breviuscula TaxID=2022672 RepID=A0A9Q0CJV4_9POAL|nr:hypothetical protein LUZ63_012010 [Rhynchospora breviuscula]
MAMARQLLRLRLFLVSSSSKSKPHLLQNLYPSSHHLLLHEKRSIPAPSLFISRLSTLRLSPGRRATADPRVTSLARKILSLDDDFSPDLESVLESNSARSMLTVRNSTDTDTDTSSNGSPFLHLLSLLKRRPWLGLRVFEWREKLRDSPPLIVEELASVIAMAGRAQNPLLACHLFNLYRPATININNPILYNVLMTAFMYNGLVDDTFSLFRELKETKYGPDTESYDILLSLCSYHILVEPMDAVLCDMDSSGIPRSVKTYKTLIHGYLRSRRWEQMEKIFDSLKEPDTSTHLLMLRGYALAGKLEKMEMMYQLVKREVHTQKRSLIFDMICAYSQVRGESSLRKIEELVKLVREEVDFPHLHIILIKAYAEKGLVDEMRKICNAFNRNIVISSHRVMRTILVLYLKYGDVDCLDFFVEQAEKAGWDLFPPHVTDAMVNWGC